MPRSCTRTTGACASWPILSAKKTTGFYYLIEFRAEGSVINDLEVAYKRDERLLRFLTVSLDKHAVAYNEKKRAKKAEAPAEA